MKLSEIDLAILRLIYSATREERSVEDAGAEAGQMFGLTLDSYGGVLQRLERDGLIEAEVVPAGGGIGFARPRGITEKGIDLVEALGDIDEGTAGRE